MNNKYQDLTETQHNKLPKLLQNPEELFDGTFGTWKTFPVDIKLKEDAKPICSRPYLSPNIRKGMFLK